MIGRMMHTVIITGKGYQDTIMKHLISVGMKQAIRCATVFRHRTIGWNQYMTVTGITGSQGCIPIVGMIMAVMGVGIFGIAAGV
ncbi:hypothetical protein SDC9_117918 [bioreactor metagenome]|uniref:Uncharacterized protein n=1 Tax=bioreactor metagenome TaxID=1076179 RepID=A0A645C0A7_9ZZZZ